MHEIQFVVALPEANPGGHPEGLIDPPPPVLDMTDGGFSWTKQELEEAVRLMRNRLFESDPELDEDLPRRAHLRERSMT